MSKENDFHFKRKFSSISLEQIKIMMNVYLIMNYLIMYLKIFNNIQTKQKIEIHNYLY